VAFRGTAARGRLEGKITTDRVDIRLVDKLPPSVVTLDVTEVNVDGKPTSEKRESKPAEPSLIDLDITIDLPRSVYIEGRGLESEWGGSFRVTGTTNTPRVEGSLKIIRGQFTFVGKRFTIPRGLVTLDGGTEIEPRIDIAAEYTQGEFTATISVSGPASDPKLVLSSSPPMPQSEILPRILFGRNSSQLSAVQAAQLALALQSLASGGSNVGDDILSRIQDTFGIDVLSVENVGEDGQGTGVRVGRYVGDRIYVETVQGSQPGSTVYRIEVKIVGNLSAESSIGQGTGNASGFLGLRWEYRY
jgi:autotransporter translocation and assembly factor TamB